MARIDPQALATLTDMLDQLRAIPGLSEIKPGIFYLKRIPMLHFHLTDEGIVADLKRVLPRAGGFDRYPLRGKRGRQSLLTDAANRCR